MGREAEGECRGQEGKQDGEDERIGHDPFEQDDEERSDPSGQGWLLNLWGAGSCGHATGFLVVRDCSGMVHGWFMLHVRQ
jgi:hypothetical protein